jgi:hypothetical protein
MKKLIPGLLALLILICSCSTKKSFLSQRYTHFKHVKPTTANEKRAYAWQEAKAPAVAPAQPAITNPELISANPAGPSNANKLVYTRAAINQVVLPVVLKGKEQLAGLVASSAMRPVTKLTKIKTLQLDQKLEKRSLLWGVIDAILALILIVVFVILVTWLILILI